MDYFSISESASNKAWRSSAAGDMSAATAQLE